MLNEAQKVINRINDEKDIYEKMMNIYNQKIKDLEYKLNQNKFAINSTNFKIVNRDCKDDESFISSNHSPSNIQNGGFSHTKRHSSNYLNYDNRYMLREIEENSEIKNREDDELLNSIGARTEKVYY